MLHLQASFEILSMCMNINKKCASKKSANNAVFFYGKCDIVFNIWGSSSYISNMQKALQ